MCLARLAALLEIIGKMNSKENWNDLRHAYFEPRWYFKTLSNLYHPSMVLQNLHFSREEEMKFFDEKKYNWSYKSIYQITNVCNNGFGQTFGSSRDSIDTMPDCLKPPWNLVILDSMEKNWGKKAYRMRTICRRFSTPVENATFTATCTCATHEDKIVACSRGF